MGGGAIYQDFDAKLRMTALVTGCSSRKHLVGLFHAANPETQCTLERLHKWLQGRALPRSATICDDLAVVLGCERGGAWVAACSLEDFASELERLFGRPAEELLAAQPFAGRGTRTAAPAAAAMPQVSGSRYLCGRYSCYSLAWSPYATGKLLRAELSIEPGRGRVLAATYVERIFDKTVRMAGTVSKTDRTLHLHLLEQGGELPLFLSFFLPRPPAGVFCGIMSGATFLGQDPEPSACRIVAVRVPPVAASEQGEGYLDPEPERLANDLMEQGLELPAPGRVGSLLCEFLTGGGPLNQVSAQQQAGLSAELDPLHLGGAAVP